MAAESPMQLLDRLLALFRATGVIDPDEAPRPTIPVEPATRTLERFGAWCGSGSMASDKTIARDVAFARWLGFTRLDVIVNDHSASRAERTFDTYSRSKIVKLCAAASKAGLEVNLMSWIMPHARYLDEGMKILVDLLTETDAASIMFDAEEPWTQARKPMPYADAAAFVASALKGHRWGVTGIGYASVEKLGPLVREAAYMVPQAYITSRTTSLDPAHDPYALARHWRKLFGQRDLVVGLAAYNQVGIPGYTPEAALRTCFASANGAAPVGIVWWSLAQIRSSSKVANAIKAIVTQQNQQLVPRAPTPQENA